MRSRFFVPPPALDLRVLTLPAGRIFRLRTQNSVLPGNQRNTTANEDALTMRFLTRGTGADYFYSQRLDHTPRNTNRTATITTDTQKAPMPAITTPCWVVFFTTGGTSGIRIFRDLRSAMSLSLQQLRCHIDKSQREEGLRRFTQTLRINCDQEGYITGRLNGLLFEISHRRDIFAFGIIQDLL